MASRRDFKCSQCRFSVETWDDGHPYISGPDGTRHHFYHPGEDFMIGRILDNLLGPGAPPGSRSDYLQTHAGNECDHLCLDCATVSARDKSRDPMNCPHCGSVNLVRALDLEGVLCPKCREGKFAGKWRAIS